MIIDFVSPAQKRERSALVKFLLAVGLGIVVIVAGAVCWALLGYFMQRVFLFVAFAIGFGIALVYAIPFARINILRALILLLPCIASTLASILLGEYLLTALLVARESGYPLPIAAIIVSSNLDQFLSVEDTSMGLFLGIVGSILGYLNVIRAKR